MQASLAARFERAIDVGSANAALRAWMFEAALPFWGGPGHDGAGRGAREHVQLDGTPAAVGFKRMRVQARQIYAFAQAGLLGWAPGERLARDGYGFITRRGMRDDGAWVRQLSPDGAHVLDEAADLYDQAFVLFALAWYGRLTGEVEPLDRARRTVTWIRQHMAQAPAGFCNVLPQEGGPRQQNPHMHLLEAVLALHAVTHDAYYAAFAHDLADLFRQHLFDPASGTLGEFFAADWSRAPGEAGEHVEPGHHFEWVWLLDQYERQTGASAGDAVDRLYAFARDSGTDPASGLVWDAVGRDGVVQSRSVRLWPQTEALKAHVVMARRGASLAHEDVIAKVVRSLGCLFLAKCPDGTWIDRFDADGQPVSAPIPTSSFYHVMMAYATLEEYARARCR